MTTAAADLDARICVRAPYNALQAITVSPGKSAARVRRQAPMLHEDGPIAVHEFGRHAAIAGIYAASTTAPDDDRRYYLAQSSIVTPIEAGYSPDPDEMFLLNAVGEYTSPRSAVATTTMTTLDGLPVAQLDVTYQVLTERSFGRLFSYAHRPGEGLHYDTNPYTAPIQLDDVTLIGHHAAATLTATPAQCAGHFQDYPALPIAILGGAMTSVAHRCLGALTGNPDVRYRVGRINIVADRLAAAGDTVRFAAQPSSKHDFSPSSHTIHITAATDRHGPIGSMTVGMTPTGP